MGNAKSTVVSTDPVAANSSIATVPSVGNLSLKGSINNFGNLKVSGSTPTLNKPTINAPNDKSKKKKGAGSARSSMSSEGRGKPILSLAHRQIIKYCIDRSKDDLGERIYRRAIERRDDFRGFVDNLPKGQKIEMSEGLRDFLLKIAENLTDNEEVQRIAEEFGEKHVKFRANGFRPDFFASTADAMTTECVFLDAAVHPATETLTAWSTLASTIFSSVRDGFYGEMRRLRRASNYMNGKSKESMDLSTDGSNKQDDDQSSRRSNSPSIEINDEEQSAKTSKENLSTIKSEESVEKSESNNFLCPPQVY